MPRIGLAYETSVEIAANAGQFSAALIDGNGASAAAVYGEDALLLPPAGDVIAGRDAIERFWRSGIEVGLRRVELETLGRAGAGPVLYEHGHYRMRFAPVAGRARVEHGPYVLVHVQADRAAAWRWVVSTFGSPA